MSTDLQVLEQKMNKKMEKTLDGKLDEKFKHILAKLHSRKDERFEE